MIVVTGANGQLGRAVIDGLLARLPADRVVASVRDPEKAAPLAARGVVVRRGDFAQPETLTSAFAGAEQVLVISPNVLGEEGRQMSRHAIAAARAAGARRVLYTSHAGTHADSPFHNHHQMEAVLAGAAIPFTSLRHGFYAESAFYLIGNGIETGEIRAPEDGPVAWTTRADLAEADAVILAEEGRFDGISPPLTAPDACTLADLAAIASELTGREIKRVVVSEEDYQATKVAEGVPPPLAAMLSTIFRDARQGVFASTDPTLESLLGRRPQSMRDVLAARLKPDAA